MFLFMFLLRRFWVSFRESSFILEGVFGDVERTPIQSRHTKTRVSFANLRCSFSPLTVDLNARDNLTDQSLLSFSVIHGDQTVDLTRFLINSGATVFNKYPQNNSTPHSTTTARELRDGSAFRSWLKALSTGLLSLEDSRETLEVLCSAMSCEDVSNGPRISRHVDRCMIELGVAPKVNGPLFLKVRSLVAPHSARPQSLMSLSRKNIRRALSGSQRTPVVVKRLGAGQPLSATANRSLHLKLPQKLRKFITMGE